MNYITAIGEIIFDVYSDYNKLGGAPLNFIYHIKKLTGSGILISRVGKDTQGKQALEFLRKNTFPISYIQIDNKHKTGTAIANLDKNKIPHWEILPGAAYDFMDIPKEIDEIMQSTKCFYFGSLSQRMEKSRTTVHSFLGRNSKYFFDINIRQHYYTREILEISLNAADVLKVNEEELILLHNIFFPGTFDLTQSVLNIMKKFKIETTALTMGEKGAWLFKNKESNFYKTTGDNIIDTTGAGDAYSAMLCLGYLNNLNLDKINRIASDFASEIIKLPGAIPHEDTFYDKFRSLFSSTTDS